MRVGPHRQAHSLADPVYNRRNIDSDGDIKLVVGYGPLSFLKGSVEDHCVMQCERICYYNDKSSFNGLYNKESINIFNRAPI